MSELFFKLSFLSRCRVLMILRFSVRSLSCFNIAYSFLKGSSAAVQTQKVTGLYDFIVYSIFMVLHKSFNLIIPSAVSRKKTTAYALHIIVKERVRKTDICIFLITVIQS